MDIRARLSRLASTGLKLSVWLLVVIAVGISGYGQSSTPISIGEIVSIRSSILNENRDLWIYVPQSAQETNHAKKRYPVVYLLDGSSHFYSVVGMIQQLSSVNGNTLVPEMMVVGIPNTDRMRDLTPTHPKDDKDDFVKTSGGGEKFLAFIEKELMPYIDAKYPSAPYRTLIGHSLGGLTVMQALIHHTALFNSYVSIDPSMWWDDQRLLKESKQILSERKFSGRSIYVGSANTFDEGMDKEIADLFKTLEATRQSGLRSETKYYPNDDHGSVPFITEYDALRFLFSYYPLKLSKTDYSDPSVDLVEKVEKHFQMVSKEMGYEVKPTESTVNALGYQMLGGKQYKKAEALFRLNVSNYPSSSNVFDSYGDYFVAKGDTASAIAQYKKALALNDNSATRNKLDKLEAGK